MCGIAGIFNYAEPDRDVDRELLVRMTRKLAHRGPDGEGFYVSGPVGLGHRRLAIVDVSPTGAQPMSDPDGNYCLAFNGEFYNHRSYRQRLESNGHHFRGSSDTETLLYLLQDEDPDCLTDVAGIFALAFWDKRRHVLTLARDPLGVKQLYYYDDGRRLLFGSEIKALLESADVPRQADPEGVNQYLHFHTPLFDRTFFRHIKQLRAGEYLQISRHSARVRKYWTVGDFGGTAHEPESRVDELRDQLKTIVGEQLMSDVPVGCFFSAGIDSSAVAGFAVRNGRPLECFGVHFTDQGVVDERPYQEAAARKMGLSLNLITLDGSSFRDDLPRLMYIQDQPVIGSAMFPMYSVSKLAAEKVKVCLGGQAADEIFGGYARYALTNPGHVIRSWFGRRTHGGATGAPAAVVGGNLGRQLRDVRNLRRLWKTAASFGTWEDRYFNHSAKVPEAAWRNLVSAPEFFNREQCRSMFHDSVRRSPAPDAPSKAMHWDIQTYLTGLFQQDDRMSMAVSLESRVPLADPRLVRFACQTSSGLKFRAGATKWILRRAVADMLPPDVLNRRKVGFDTPVERWMKHQHLDFVREMLLSQRSRTRGIFDAKRLAALIDATDEPFWIDLVWKALAVETWCTVFLDANAEGDHAAEPIVYQATSDPRARPTGETPHPISIPDVIQEIREMGVRGAVSRAAWEVKVRLGSPQLETARRKKLDPPELAGADHPSRKPPFLFANPEHVVQAIRGRLLDKQEEQLAAAARESTLGRIICFGRWTADFDNPIDWHKNPHNGQRWPAERHWSRSLTNQQRIGDVKLTWEAARFPQAYRIARAAACRPHSAGELCAAFTEQVRSFVRENPRDHGIHWNSGQEIAIRLVSLVFALDAFSQLPAKCGELSDVVLRYIPEAAEHIARHIEFARNSVNNNHLISEAVGLFLAGCVSSDPRSNEWMKLGHDLLSSEAERQFFSDGGYLQQSHNYHRSVLQLYLCATALARRRRTQEDKRWLAAMERSLDFLYPQQNPEDGRLPNYGANDGAMPCVLTCCDFSDFRPLLQALSIACRGERIYEPGPWDEEAAWLFGAGALDLPLRTPNRKSASFTYTGHHVLRGNEPSSFTTFRCGTVRERFSQIDMLHLDVWWRGQNVLVDGGSYLYNAGDRWHDHFHSTAVHNTVTVDNRDQMLHLRKFKNIHWIRAKLERFEDTAEWALCGGTHYGYRNGPDKGCIHRRTVLFLKDDTWIVVDELTGAGAHSARLHWLCGPYPHDADAMNASLVLDTPAGPFSVAVRDQNSAVPTGDIVAGQETPPRGWLSRYYGEKLAVPSLAVESRGELPQTFVSVLGAGRRISIDLTAGTWRVRTERQEVQFRQIDGSIELLTTGKALLHV